VRPFQHLNLVYYTNIYINNALKLYGRKEFLFIIFEIIGPSHIITKEQRELREDFYLVTIVNKYNFIQKAHALDNATIEKIRQMRLNRKSSKETREKLSRLFSGENNPFFGKKHSEEYKKGMSDSRKGSNNPMHNKVFSPAFLAHQTKNKFGENNHMSKAITLVNLDTNKIFYFESQIEASTYVGYKSKTPIQQAIKKKSILTTKNGERYSVQHTPHKKPD
jgi:group I intron endonuclease